MLALLGEMGSLPGRDNIHLVTEHILQTENELTQVQHSASGFHLGQEVDVAVRLGLIPCH